MSIRCLPGFAVLGLTCLLTSLASAETEGAAPTGESQPPPPPPAYQQQQPGKIDLSTPPPAPIGRRTKRHDGFYLRMNLGVGGMITKVEYEPALLFDEVDVSGGGGTFGLMLGGTLDHVVLGGGFWLNSAPDPKVEYAGFEGESSGNTLNMFLVGPFIDWYPDLHGGFHLGGAIGWAGVVITDDSEEENLAESAGGGAGLFVGYDWFVADEWSLGVLGRFTAASTTGDRNETQDNIDVTVRTQAFSVEFTALFH